MNYNFNKVDAWIDAKFWKMPLPQGCTRSKRVWLKPGERLMKWAVKNNPAYKAPGAHILAGFGNGRMLFVKQYVRMNATTAAKMFKKAIAPALRRAYPNKTRFLVMMDGEPSFRSMLVKQTLADLKIKKFEVPPRSGDTAPMETVWADRTKARDSFVMNSPAWSKGKRNTKANKAQWAKDVTKVIWKAKRTFLTKLVDGMKKRAAALVKNKGGPIRW